MGRGRAGDLKRRVPSSTPHPPLRGTPGPPLWLRAFVVGKAKSLAFPGLRPLLLTPQGEKGSLPPGPPLRLRAFVVGKAKSLAFPGLRPLLLTPQGEKGSLPPGPPLRLRAFVVGKAKSLAFPGLRPPLLTPTRGEGTAPPGPPLAAGQRQVVLSLLASSSLPLSLSTAPPVWVSDVPDQAPWSARQLSGVPTTDTSPRMFSAGPET